MYAMYIHCLTLLVNVIHLWECKKSTGQKIAHHWRNTIIWKRLVVVCPW